ncbi:MAG: LuxR family transcriptional regulator [Caulobacterales bacterium]
MPISAFLQKCRAATDETTLFRAFREFTDRYEADVVIYNLLIENLHHLPPEQSSIYHDAPPELVRRYSDKKYFYIDPILHAVVKAREAFHWYDCGKIIPLSPAQENYLEELRKIGLKDGLAIPIHTGLGSASFFAIGSTKRAFELNPEEECRLWCVCLHVHNRCMELRGKYPERDARLSKRETQVLTLVAQGKSNTTIAKALGLSDHTIDTLVRRSFVKLGVSDRISAALKAVGTGAVQI